MLNDAYTKERKLFIKKISCEDRNALIEKSLFIAGFLYFTAQIIRVSI